MNTVIKRAWNKNKLVKVEDLTGMTFQAESGGHTFEISGVDDTGAAVSLSGTVEGRFLRADNAEIIISGTASGGKASVTLSAACYAIPGRFLLTIYVTSDGQKVAVYAATGSVVATSGTASGSIPPLVTDSVQANTGTFGSISTGNATVDGVLDVTKRRTVGRITDGAGWYRVFHYDAREEADLVGDECFTIDIKIYEWARQYHKITLYGVLNAVKFDNEISVTNVDYIDKIRYMKNGTHGYIDVHFNNAQNRQIACFFDVKCSAPGYLWRFIPYEITQVATSPEGETPLAEYTFATNTDGDITSQITFNNASTVKARRNGNTINISYQGDNINHSEGEVVATFPAGLQSSSIHWCIGYIKGVQAVLRINPGNITIWDAQSYPSGRLYFEATYIL